MQATARRSCCLRLVVASLPLALLAPVARADVPSTAVGTVHVLHGDDFVHHRSTYSYSVHTADGVVPLTLQGAGAIGLAGARVRVEGTPAGDELRPVASGGDPAIDVLSAPAPRLASGQGAQRVAVLLVTSTGAQPLTRSQVQGRFFDDTDSIRAFYDEESWGRIALTGTVFDWVTVPPMTDCTNDAQVDQLSASAETAQAQQHGFVRSSFDRVVYVFPDDPSCPWAGLGEVPVGGQAATHTWVNGLEQPWGVQATAHELGHNFGLHHANSLRCVDGAGHAVTVSGSCTSTEYGDPYDVMGLNLHQLDVWHKGQAGWLGAGNVTTVAATGTYTIAPVSGSGAIGLQVARGATGSSFWIESRASFGVDSYPQSSPALSGVLIHLNAPWDQPPLSQSQLLDGTPGTTSFADAPLPVGQTFTDAASGVTIRPVDVSPLGATVYVGLGGANDATPPSTPAALVGTSSFGSHVHLSWAPSSDDVAVAGYRVARGGVVLGTSPTAAFDDVTTTPATSYGYTVAAFDSAGNVSATSPVATITTSATVDTVAPTTPAGLRAALSSASTVSLTWQASSDNDIVARYRVYRDGALVATVDGPSAVDSGLVAGTAYAYVVRAVDAAGNPSGASAPATVGVPGAAPTGAGGGTAAPGTSTAVDGTAPSVPGRLAVAVRGGTAVLTWQASSDAVGVSGYEVWRNGQRAASGLRGLTWSDPGFAAALTGGGARYAVRALDAAGNASALTPAVLAQVPRISLRLERAGLAPVAGGRRLGVVARLLKAGSVRPACSYRAASGPWRPCRFDAAGRARITLLVPGRRGPIALVVRAVPLAGAPARVARVLR